MQFHKHLRTLSDSILRANVGEIFHAIQLDAISHLQCECLTALDDPLLCIRFTASSLVSIIACKWEIWNKLYSKFNKIVRSDDVPVRHKNIYEDWPNNIFKG